MAIHGNYLFEEFLGGVRVERVPTDSPNVQLTNQPKPLYVVYPRLPLQLESVLTVIRTELTTLGCADSRDVALATLALIAETRPDSSSSVTHANDRLRRVRTAKLHFAVVTARAASAFYLA